IAIKPRTVDEILEGFGLKKISAAKIMMWKIPSYRPDLQRDVDLIEEVVRVYGADQIPGTDRSRFTPSSEADHAHDLESGLREKLAASGLYEVRTSKLLARERFAFGESAIELRNPLSEDHVALRASLLTGLIGVLDRNIRAGAERVSIFEIGRVFEGAQATEKKRVAVLLWGNASSHANWRGEKRSLDFFDLKSALQLIRSDLTFSRGRHNNFALAVEIYAANRLIGLAGQLSNSVLANIDAPGAVFAGEVSVDFPTIGLDSRATFHELGKFPAVVRDIAMLVPDDLTHEKVLEAIWTEPPSFLERAASFDRVVGKEAEKLFGAGRKSLAYRLTYRDQTRTLTSEEVSAAHAKIRERLRRDVGAELRE